MEAGRGRRGPGSTWKEQAQCRLGVRPPGPRPEARHSPGKRQMQHPLGLQTKGCGEIPGTWHTKEKVAGAWVGGRFAYWGQSRKLLRKKALGLRLERGVLPTGTPEGNGVWMPWPLRYQLQTVCSWGALAAVHRGSRQLRVRSTSQGEL